MTEVFYDTYHALNPGCAVVAESQRSGRLMGSCFYHPRKHHVSLGIMNVHPNYFGLGVGRALLKHIIDYTDEHGYDALRLTQSALNLDSFSLYNRAGFVPRYAYQDMVVRVPEDGWTKLPAGAQRVRDATADDLTAIAELELEVSGICREEDYRLALENRAGYWHLAVVENAGGALNGWTMSCGHTAMNMIGPCVARDEATAAALIARELDRHRGRAPVMLIPMEKYQLVQQLYDWGARNCELHLCQVRGRFQQFRGVSMPTFLPETG